MGTWGPALFSDDTACDVRDGYRDLLGDGVDPEEAMRRLINEWREAIDDPELGGVFWMALAATQWSLGRLADRVRDEALKVIESEADHARWIADPKTARARARHLARLGEKLRSPQPRPRRVAKRFRDSCDWQLGEVLAYRLMSGRWVLFRMVALHEDVGGRAPVVELLDWSGAEVPRDIDLSRIPRRAGAGVWSSAQTFILGRLRERELPADRLVRLGVPGPVLNDSDVLGPLVFLWRTLDQQLRDIFGVD